MIGVNYVLSATTTGLQKGIAKAKMSFDGMRRSIKSAGAAMTSFLGVGLGSAGLLKLSSDALTLAKSLDDASKKLGVSRELLQELGFAGEQFGVSQDTVNMAMQRFTRRLGEAQQGAGELLPSLKQYNIALTDSNGAARDAGDVLKDYAEAIKGAETPQERLRLAFKAFDSEGAALVTVLQDGSKGLDGWAKKAREAGAVMEEEVVKDLAAASQEIENFRKRITVAMGNIIVNFQSEEGLKLLGLQLLKQAAAFGGGVLDALTEAYSIGGAIWKGIFVGSINTFKDGLIDAAIGFGNAFNSVIPDFLKDKGFSIPITGLESFKSTGEGVAESIDRAIAETSPATFKQDFTSFWDDAIQKQKGVIKSQQEVNKENAIMLPRVIKAGADEVRVAGQDAGDSIADGGKTAAKEIKSAAKGLGGIFGRGAEAIQDATDDALRELIQREERIIREQRGGGNASRIGASMAIAQSQSTIQRARQELAFRSGLRADVDLLGVNGARRVSSIDPLAFDKVVSEIVTGRDVSEKSLDELKVQTRLLSGKFRNQ